MYNSVACSKFPMLGSYHLCIVLKHLHHPQSKLVSIILKQITTKLCSPDARQVAARKEWV